MNGEKIKRAALSGGSGAPRCDVTLKALTVDQVRQIDRVLSEAGPFAELRLVKENGKLCSMRKLESESFFPPLRKRHV